MHTHILRYNNQIITPPKEEQKGKERAEYGKALIKELSIRISRDYGKGFNERNLWYMRTFYSIFPKVNALRSELSWTHYRLLLRVEKELERELTREREIIEMEKRMGKKIEGIK